MQFVCEGVSVQVPLPHTCRDPVDAVKPVARLALGPDQLTAVLLKATAWSFTCSYNRTSEETQCASGLFTPSSAVPSVTLHRVALPQCSPFCGHDL